MNSEVWIDHKERYVKQSFRNRAYIMTGNGKQILSIPVIHTKKMESVSEVAIEYVTPWQRNHWKTIESAYGTSPYFLYYRDALQPFYEHPTESLFDFNLSILQTILRLLKIPTTIHLTPEPIPFQENDLRALIHPRNSKQGDYPLHLPQPYYQVFNERYGFISNLSIIDLLFNLGPDAVDYLRKSSAQFENTI